MRSGAGELNFDLVRLGLIAAVDGGEAGSGHIAGGIVDLRRDNECSDRIGAVVVHQIESAAAGNIGCDLVAEVGMAVEHQIEEVR